MGSSVGWVKRERIPGGESQLEWRLKMMYRIAFPFLALAVASGCGDRNATGPMITDTGRDANAAVSDSRNAGDDNDGQISRRSGALHLTKDCIGTYNGAALDFCTITKSNVEQIKLGSTVVYQTKAGATSLSSDVILYPPHSGKNIAFGHCALDFGTGLGHCDFLGGTGKFKGFNASVTVTCAGGICALDGTYSFSSKSDDED